MASNEILKPETRPSGEKPNSTLDNYHAKSFENVMPNSNSMILKNLKKTKPDSSLNRKLIANLANKHKKTIEDKSIIIQKQVPETKNIDDGSIITSDAYSYMNDMK